MRATADGSESRLVRRGRRGREAEVQPRGEPVRARRTRLNAVGRSESRGAVWNGGIGHPVAHACRGLSVCVLNEEQRNAAGHASVYVLTEGSEATPPMTVKVIW